MNRLKVLHIASWYPSRMSPQNGNFIQRHVEAIGQFTDSYLLHVVSDSSADETEITVQNETNFQFCIVVYPKASVTSRYGRSKNAHNVGLERIMEIENDFDLVHVHVLYPSIIFAQSIAEKLKIPIVVTEHATAFHNYHSKPYSWWQRWWMRIKSLHVKRFFPVSNDLGIAMQELGFRGRYETIPNVVDTALFGGSKSEITSDHFRFIHISSLNNEHKNVSGLLSAFQVVTETYPLAKLIIIGNSHHEQHKRYIHKLKLINEVELMTERSLEDVAAEMKRSDALVLFSNYENAPCVISEAHCVGIPVIATNVGGVSEMINESNGILVSPNDMLGLYQAMVDMIENHDRYDEESIRSLATKRYDYQVVGAKYLAAYRDVLSEVAK